MIGRLGGAALRWGGRRRELSRLAALSRSQSLAVIWMTTVLTCRPRQSPEFLRSKDRLGRRAARRAALGVERMALQ